MELLTRREVAKRLLIHEKNIDRVWPYMIRYGAFRISDRGSWRMAAEDLQRFIDDRRQGR